MIDFKDLELLTCLNLVLLHQENHLCICQITETPKNVLSHSGFCAIGAFCKPENVSQTLDCCCELSVILLCTSNHNTTTKSSTGSEKSS